MRALAILVMFAASAHASPNWRAYGGGAWLHYELSGLTQVGVDDPMRGPGIKAEQLVLAGGRLHGFFGKGDTIGFHGGFDFAFGGTMQRGGFAYDVGLFPLGVGVRLGRTGVFALGTGVSFMGAVGTIDDAVLLPLEATLELGGGSVRLLMRGRASYVAGADGRQSGAPSAPFADELDATVGLRIGRHYEDYGFPTGNGYFIGASYREIAGTRFAGVVIGYSIDMATRRGQRDY